MKRFSLIAVVAALALLAFASLAMAAPGEYLFEEVEDPENPGEYILVPVEGHGTQEDLEENLFKEGDYEGTHLDPHSKTRNPITFPNGMTIVNANRSGEIVPQFDDGYARNVPGQPVHTDFQKNTNSCASCHMTHTAQGRSLLFRTGVYATCAACHDGSGMPFFNVFETSESIVSDRPDTAGDHSLTYQHRVSGTFGVNLADHNGSVHLATGDLSMKAAPGGNRLGQDKHGEDDDSGDWGDAFTCASCHAPHGSYSYRLLHGNPNDIARRTAQEGGLKVVEAEAVHMGDGVYRVVELGADAEAANASRLPFRVGSASIFVDGIAGTGFTVDNAAGTFTHESGEEVDGEITITADRFLRVDGPAGLDVLATGATDVAAYVTDANRAMYAGHQNALYYNFFCAACHTDYERKLTTRTVFGQGPDAADPEGDIGGSRNSMTGIFSGAHRHSTHFNANTSFEVVGGTGTMLCVSCHYVHGTDNLIMKTADELVIGKVTEDYVAAAEIDGVETVSEYIDYMGDINPSSALKRYTNMASCWKCHAHAGFRSATWQNTEYWQSGKADGSIDSFNFNLNEGTPSY
ncbi:cytochrome c3 family protein [Dethiobacter alkaliphilus]|uniref:cytochrome c3 family protein n=1 Tax=Dethiobacter alkaliphilus TaxID=427926 RepID=UPI002226A7A2|nr:cytochrome c3 family protein [Dethiobacter alkaliphilus]MCW3491323.1 cytochrome C [Dethiobacter alkaliphilus]